MFLPTYCFVGAIIGFDIDKAMNAGGFNKRRTVTIAVLRQPLFELVTPIYRVP